MRRRPKKQLDWRKTKTETYKVEKAGDKQKFIYLFIS